MSSLNRPNSVTLWNALTETNTGIDVRVGNGSDEVNLSVTDDGQEDVIVACTLTMENALSLILDLVTAVQVAMSNRRG